jgi:hypothetical protein
MMLEYCSEGNQVSDVTREDLRCKRREMIAMFSRLVMVTGLKSVFINLIQGRSGIKVEVESTGRLCTLD